MNPWLVKAKEGEEQASPRRSSARSKVATLPRRAKAPAAREEAAELKGEAARLRAKLDASDAAASRLRGDALAGFVPAAGRAGLALEWDLHRALHPPERRLLPPLGALLALRRLRGRAPRRPARRAMLRCRHVDVRCKIS